jgi:hypothetical protein
LLRRARVADPPSLLRGDDYFLPEIRRRSVASAGRGRIATRCRWNSSSRARFCEKVEPFFVILGLMVAAFLLGRAGVAWPDQPASPPASRRR